MQKELTETDSHIIVIVRDQPGGLARITTALAEAEINIEMIDGRRAGEFGVVKLSTDNDDEAMRVSAASQPADGNLRCGAVSPARQARRAGRA